MAKIEVPQELINKTYDAFNSASVGGKIRKGSNETTKAIERKQALLVAIADDTSPPEIVAHIPILCDEKGIPYLYVPKKEELGKAAGMSVPTAAAAIVEAGESKKLIDDIASQLKTLKGGKSEGKKAEKPAKEAAKPEKAEEAPKEEKAEKPKKEEAPKEAAKPEKEEPKEEKPVEKAEEKKEEKPEKKPVEEKKEEAPKEEPKEEKPEEKEEKKE